MPNVNLSPLISRVPFIACSVIMEKDPVNIFSLCQFTQRLVLSVQGAQETRQKEGAPPLASDVLLLAPVILLPASHLETFTSAYPQQLLVVPLQTISLWFSVVALWADPHWVPQDVQWPASQPRLHTVGFQLASHGCGSPSICFNLPVPRRGISSWPLSAEVPYSPASA